MKKTLVKLLLAFIISTVISLPLFAVDAKVTYVKGKVEVSHNGSEWIPLKTGDSISQSDTINTGFQSEARINLNGSIMAVPALTRITIETLKTSSTKDTVSLYVNTGAVRSKVTHTDNKKIDYTARTAVAVASVRGTDYTVTAGGLVSCGEGAVAVTANRDGESGASTESSDEKDKEEGEESGNEEGSDSTDTDSSDSKGSATDNRGETNESNTDNTSDTKNDSNKDNKSANATTDGKSISSTSTDGTIVVGAGMTAKLNSTGDYDKSTTQSQGKSDKIKNSGNTQAQKDAKNNGGTKVDSIPNEVPIPTTGTVIVNIVLEAD